SPIRVRRQGRDLPGARAVRQFRGHSSLSSAATRWNGRHVRRVSDGRSEPDHRLSGRDLLGRGLRRRAGGGGTVKTSDATTSLDGRTAVITGGSRGIGKAIAARFVCAGANVVIVSRREESLRATAAELGQQVAWYATSVRDPDGPLRA